MDFTFNILYKFGQQINKYFMTQLTEQSYLDNEHLFSGHQFANDIVLQIYLQLSDFHENSSNWDASIDKKQKILLKIYGWLRIYEFKDHILKLLHRKGETLKAVDLRLFHKNIQLSNQKKTLLDYNVANGSTILIEKRSKIMFGTVSGSQQEINSKGVVNPYKLFEKDNQKVGKLVKLTQLAINSGVTPVLTSQGTSGVYMIQNDKGQSISIFKPFDQQVNAPNNPRQKRGKLGSQGIFKGILSGQCATRQVAAYLLDSEHGNFHGIPTTTYIQFYHPSFKNLQPVNERPIACQQKNICLSSCKSKHGSLQQFVTSSGIIGDYGSKRFTDRQIHKIGILDIRIINCDRNQENILVIQKDKTNLKLIPIDHGLSFPDNLQIYQQSLLWMSMPQSQKPFSEQQLKFIEQINPNKDTQILDIKLGFRQICLRNFKIAQIFLKKAASMGFTLYQMGKMLYRTEDYDEEAGAKNKTKRSNIQSLVMQAQTLYLNAMQSIQKQNIEPPKEDVEFGQFFDDFELEQLQNESSSNSSSTCQSIKSILSLRKKTSLPQLKRKDTSFHELRSKARKQREGINGISKSIWNKYHQQEWNQLFYYYFGNLLQTFLTQKSMVQARKLSQRSQSAK